MTNNAFANVLFANACIVVRGKKMACITDCLIDGSPYSVKFRHTTRDPEYLEQFEGIDCFEDFDDEFLDFLEHVEDRGYRPNASITFEEILASLQALRAGLEADAAYVHFVVDVNGDVDNYTSIHKMPRKPIGPDGRRRLDDERNKVLAARHTEMLDTHELLSDNELLAKTRAELEAAGQPCVPAA